MQDQSSKDEEEREWTPPSRGYQLTRWAMIGTYALVALGMLSYPSLGNAPANMTTLLYLFGVYLLARALAMFVKFRQEMRPPRYSMAYARADDLFPPKAPPPPTPGNGKTHG